MSASSSMVNGSIKSQNSLPQLPADLCLICYDIQKPSDSFIPCSHRYHLQCIKEWCMCEETCPECMKEIKHLYIETPDDCEMFHLQRIRSHYSRKKLMRLTVAQLKQKIAEHIDASKDQHVDVRIALQEILIAKHLIKFLRTKKKQTLGCKTDYLLEITNRQLIHTRKALKGEYDIALKAEQDEARQHEQQQENDHEED